MKVVYMNKKECTVEEFGALCEKDAENGYEEIAFDVIGQEFEIEEPNDKLARIIDNNKSEKEVQRALDNISQKNVTTIIIAHRLSTIEGYDKVIDMDKGGGL